jgi:hypothetical protein
MKRMTAKPGDIVEVEVTENIDENAIVIEVNRKLKEVKCLFPNRTERKIIFVPYEKVIGVYDNIKNFFPFDGSNI